MAWWNGRDDEAEAEVERRQVAILASIERPAPRLLSEVRPPEASGVYMIHNAMRTHRYVGATANLQLRFRQHGRSMRGGHWPYRLKEVVAIWPHLWFTVLFLCDEAELPQREAEAVIEYAADLNSTTNYARRAS